MLAPMVVLACACAAIGVLPAALVPALARAAGATGPSGPADLGALAHLGTLTWIALPLLAVCALAWAWCAGRPRPGPTCPPGTAATPPPAPGSSTPPPPSPTAWSRPCAWRSGPRCAGVRVKGLFPHPAELPLPRAGPGPGPGGGSGPGLRRPRPVLAALLPERPAAALPALHPAHPCGAARLDGGLTMTDSTLARSLQILAAHPHRAAAAAADPGPDQQGQGAGGRAPGPAGAAALLRPGQARAQACRCSAAPPPGCSWPGRRRWWPRVSWPRCSCPSATPRRR